MNKRYIRWLALIMSLVLLLASLLLFAVPRHDLPTDEQWEEYLIYEEQMLRERDALFNN